MPRKPTAHNFVELTTKANSMLFRLCRQLDQTQDFVLDLALSLCSHSATSEKVKPIPPTRPPSFALEPSPRATSIGRAAQAVVRKASRRADRPVMSEYSADLPPGAAATMDRLTLDSGYSKPFILELALSICCYATDHTTPKPPPPRPKAKPINAGQAKPAAIGATTRAMLNRAKRNQHTRARKGGG